MGVKIEKDGDVGWIIGITKETQRDREAEEVMKVEMDCKEIQPVHSEGD